MIGRFLILAVLLVGAWFVPVQAEAAPSLPAGCQWLTQPVSMRCMVEGGRQLAYGWISSQSEANEFCKTKGASAYAHLGTVSFNGNATYSVLTRCDDPQYGAGAWGTFTREASFDASRQCPAGTNWSEATKTCQGTCPAGEWPDPSNPSQCLNRDKCVARNSGIDTSAVANWHHAPGGNNTWRCVAGCKLARTTNEGTSCVDGKCVTRGARNYSGDQCSADPVQPDYQPPVAPDEGLDKPETERPKEWCNQAANLTMCVNEKGEHCATASTGRRICWQPGETGTRTDQNTQQEKQPGPTHTPPPLTLPNGDTLTQTAGPVRVDHTRPNGVTNVTNVTNYTTGSGANAGPRNSGQNSDGTGQEDKNGNSASGGGDCKAPPVVSGDAAMNMVANQAWATRCAIEAGNTVKVTGDVGDCKSAFSVTGSPDNANVAKLRAMREQICGVEEIKEDLSQQNTDYGAEFDPEGAFGDTSGLANLVDQAGFGWGSSCPALPSINLGVIGGEIDASWLCTLMQALGSLILLGGFVQAAYIIGRA